MSNQDPIVLPPIPTDWGPLIAQVRSGITALLTLAATLGYFNAGNVSTTVNAVLAILIAGAWLANIVWTAIANSRATKIKTVGALPDVAVIVGPKAPDAAIKAAVDPSQPGVVPVSHGTVMPPGTNP